MNHGAHLTLANSTSMAIIVSVVIAIVLIQPVIFLFIAWRHGRNIGIQEEHLKATAVSSGVFSIIPSLPIVISFLILAPALGKYFAWLRLSVVGSATYETLAANMAVRAYGIKDIFAVDISEPIYLGIMLFVTLGIIGGNVFNLILLKPYENNLDKFKEKYAATVPVLTAAMLLGVYGSLAAPYITDVTNPQAIAAIVVAGITTVLFGKFAANMPRLKEFTFSLSLLAGMFSASIVSVIFG